MTRKTKYAIAAGILIAALLLVGSVAIQLRSSFKAKERAAVKQAPPPTLLTTIKPAGSIPDLRAAATRSPKDAGAWSRLGDASLAGSDLPGAIGAYKHAVALDDSRWQDWSALGEAYVQTEQANGAMLPKPAKDAFNHVLKLHPTDMRTQFYLAMEQDFTGGHDRAIDVWLGMLAQVPMGSKPDGAIRGAIIASVARHAIAVRDRMSAATDEQKKLRPVAR